MANPLARTIMNNISKKSGNKKIEGNLGKSINGKCIKNINEKEENILKNILYKNKASLNSLNSIKESKKNIKIQEKSLQKNSIDDLLNKSNNKTNESIKTKPKIKTQSLKSLNLNSKCEENIKKHTSEKQIKKITSLRDLAK